MRVRPLLFSLGAVALVSVAVWALEPVAPVVSLGVLYLFAVLPVAALWGLRYAVPVSIVSMLAFNWFFLPPTHTLQLHDSENWVALTVYLLTAVSVSWLAARRRSLEREDIAKTAVLRSVSHDLRSPITAILTASEVASGDVSDAERNELLDSIRAQAERLDRLVANLLDLSRLQADAVHADPAPCAIDDIVVQALREMGGRAERVEVSLPDHSPVARVDAVQVERALVNLIENALEYSPAQEPVRLQVLSHGTHGLVRVIDHGPGVASDEAERIFEPFHRGRSAGSVRGAGLGLAIARGFAEASGGRVWVESRGGQGATFTLELPLAEDGA